MEDLKTSTLEVNTFLGQLNLNNLINHYGSLPYSPPIKEPDNSIRPGYNNNIYDN